MESQAVQKCVNLLLITLDKCNLDFKIYLQKSASIPPRTRPPKFDLPAYAGPPLCVEKTAMGTVG